MPKRSRGLRGSRGSNKKIGKIGKSQSRTRFVRRLLRAEKEKNEIARTSRTSSLNIRKMSGDVVHYQGIDLDMTVFALTLRISKDPDFETPETYRVRLFSSNIATGYFFINEPGRTLRSYGIEPDSQIEIFIDDPIIATYHRSIGSEIDLKEPGGVCVIGENIYVADRHLDRVSIFHLDGTFIGKIGSRGTDDGLFNYPSGICRDSKENLYVADSGNHRVQVFSRDGTFRKAFGVIGRKEADFFYPSALCVDSTDNLYVVDNGNHRVQMFFPEGTFRKAFGSKGVENGQFLDPLGICVDRHDNLYVADCGCDRVQVFSPEGAFLRKIWNLPRQILRPTSLCVDRNDYLYVFDPRQNDIHVFDREGTFLKNIGVLTENDSTNNREYGSGGICLDNADHLYVTAIRNVRIFRS